jgi:hypothetical protein
MKIFSRRFLILLFVLLSAAPTLVAQTFIRVNQVGFAVGDVKIAIAFSRDSLPSSFQIKSAATNAVVFTGPAKAVAGAWGQFKYHADLDFSHFKKQGQFYIQLGESRSTVFPIQRNVTRELPDQLLEFMRQQRCGYNPFVHAACHLFDGRTAYGPLRAGKQIFVTGGWHDAGDQLKYLLTSSTATAQMLLAYQLGRSRRTVFFKDDYLQSGESGANGLPDLLDEARWGLTWMLKLHPAPDHLYHQVADDRDHKGFRLPQKETVDYGWGPGSYRVVYFADGRPQGLKEYKSESNGVANLAGRYAAAMALGYEVFKTIPKERLFAEELLKAGKEVYAMGQSKEGVQQGNSYGSPYRYAETTWADDMEWGAAELFRATRDAKYLNDAKRYAVKAGTESWMGRKEAGHYQYYPFMNLGHFRLYDLVDAKTRKQLADFYREGIETCERAGSDNPFEAGVPFIWCSNNLMVALVTQCSAYRRMTGSHRFVKFSVKQRDWLLGRNPWGMSMFTEIPHNGVFPRDVHLFTNAILKQSVRGGLVDGPVYRKVFQSLRGVFIRDPDPFAPFQDERAVYHDDINDYSTNEPTMDGTAAAILMFVIGEL